MDAAYAQRVVRIPDLIVENRWPQFVAAAVSQTPVRSMLCFPLYTGTRTWGTLVLHAYRPDGLDDGAEQAGAILAAHPALALDAMRQDRHYW
jgi:GAF domain-containing protein